MFVGRALVIFRRFIRVERSISLTSLKASDLLLKINSYVISRRQKRLVFTTVTSKMNLSDDVDLEDYVARPDKISGADINAICQEVRMFLSSFMWSFLFVLEMYCALPQLILLPFILWQWI